MTTKKETEAASVAGKNECLSSLRNGLLAGSRYSALRSAHRQGITLLNRASVERIASALGFATCTCEPEEGSVLDLLPPNTPPKAVSVFDVLQNIQMFPPNARPCFSLRLYATKDVADPFAGLNLLGLSCELDEPAVGLVVAIHTASGLRSCKISAPGAAEVAKALRDSVGQSAYDTYVVRLDTPDKRTSHLTCDGHSSSCIRALGLCLMENLQDWPRYDCPSAIDVSVDPNGRVSATNIDLGCRGSGAAARCIDRALREQQFVADPSGQGSRAAFHIALDYHFSVDRPPPLPSYGNDLLLQ